MAALMYTSITLVLWLYFGLLQRQRIEPEVYVVAAIVLDVKEYINEIRDSENPLTRVITAVESLIQPECSAIIGGRAGLV